jgi:hypothetical protein
VCLVGVAEDDAVEDEDADKEVEEAEVIDAVAVAEGVAVGVEDEGITVVGMTTVDAGGVRPPYIHSEPRGI